MKIDGLNVVYKGGVADLEATLAAWDKARDAETATLRQDFWTRLVNLSKTTEKVLPLIHKAIMTAVWEKYPAARIQKSVVVDMTVHALLAASVITPTEVPIFKKTVLDYVNDNVGAPGSNCFMWQDATKGRTAQVYLAPKKADTAEAPAPPPPPATHQEAPPPPLTGEMALIEELSKQASEGEPQNG